VRVARFAAGNSVNDFFRNERHAGGNLCSRAQSGARAEVFVSFLCFGGERFILPTRKDGDLTLAGNRASSNESWVTDRIMESFATESGAKAT
jgi:hypothetical protein